MGFDSLGNLPAMQHGLNTLKNRETDLPSPQKRGIRKIFLLSGLHKMVKIEEGGEEE